MSTIKDAINFIIHLQLENERLQTIGNHHCPKCVFGIRESAKSEAIKEFAERLREIYKKHLVCSFNVLNNEIDNLVIEMTAKDTSVSLVDGHIEAEKGR